MSVLLRTTRALFRFPDNLRAGACLREQSARARSIAGVALLALFSAALIPGIRYLLHYESTPGAQAAAPSQWPGNTSLPEPKDVARLVVVLHPRCSCSQATLSELEDFAARPHKPFHAIFLVYQPAASQLAAARLTSANSKNSEALSNSTLDPAWRAGEMYRHAQEAMHAQVITDSGGQLAQRFGALTSGQVLLYSADGSLLFSGGVTGSRGVTGDNDGLASLERALDQTAPRSASTAKGATQGAAQNATSPVFGCSLLARVQSSRPWVL